MLNPNRVLPAPPTVFGGARGSCPTPSSASWRAAGGCSPASAGLPRLHKAVQCPFTACVALAWLPTVAKSPGVPPPAARAPSGPTLRRATGCKPRRWGFSRSAEGWALWVYDRWSSLPIATGGTCQLGKQVAEPLGWASSWGPQAMCRSRARVRPLCRRGSGEFRRGKRMGPAHRVAFSRP